MKRKLLIIKTGRSETFCERESGEICSFGDVLRSSFIVSLFDSFEITWATDIRAIKLLGPVTSLKSVIDFDTIKKSEYSEFDLIINLEKDQVSLEINNLHENSFGFINTEDGIAVKTYPSGEVINLDNLERTLKFSKYESYQIQLCKILERQWSDLDFDYLYHGGDKDKYDIGINWKVGPKWPKKRIDKNFWQQLSNELDEGRTISWQEGFDDILQYIEWINSCKTLITLDSLGLHLAIALKKNVIALFGPTNPHEVEMYDRGVKITYSKDTDFLELITAIKKQL